MIKHFAIPTLSMKNLSLLILLLLPLLGIAQADADGCSDHPLISRYPDATIISCTQTKFGEYHIATGDLTGYRYIDEWVDVEGQVYRYNYELSSTAIGMSEVYLNYRNALQRAGFETLAMGLDANRTKSNSIGGSQWVGTAFIKNRLPQNSQSRLLTGSSSSGGYGYIAAQLSRPGGTVYAVVTTYQYRSDVVVVQLDIIEEGELEDGKVTVDPDYLASELDARGAVALYGIYFDFDQAVVKPESAQNLQAIATYLRQHPEVSLYVVGHTDMKGKLAYNLDLSARRAQAVIDKLSADYAISKSRLEAQGVGPLVPRSTNTTDDGRGLNRRVELVMKIE